MQMRFIEQKLLQSCPTFGRDDLTDGKMQYDFMHLYYIIIIIIIIGICHQGLFHLHGCRSPHLRLCRLSSFFCWSEYINP